MVPAADGLGLAGGAALASVVLPMLGLGSAGWICATASVVGIALYMLSVMLSKMPVRPTEPLAAADAATLER
jgi:predicted MFS family arabinose efflux permease